MNDVPPRQTRNRRDLRDGAGSALPPALVLLFTLGLGAAPALAQSGASGSATSHSTARDLPTAGGAASSPGFSVESSVAHATAGPGMSSASYSFEGGVAWTPGSWSPPGPVVFGVADPRGPKEGGSVETVRGLGFQAPGGGTPSVSFGGTPASSALVIGDTEIRIQAPSGLDTLGNTLGVVDVTVANGLGTSTAQDAFAYTPALVSFEPGHVGQGYELHLYDQPGALQGVNLGLSIPGFAVPLPPLSGAYGLLALSVTLFPLAFSTDETATWTLPIPPSPSLVGQSIQLQGVSISSLDPLVGSFTNLHTLTVIE